VSIQSKSSQLISRNDQLKHENEQLHAELESLRNQLSKMYKYVRLAHQDPLTGLNNRRYFDKRAKEELSRVKRKKNSAFSILMIDINDFKQINDCFGHTQGDNVLCWVAKFLEENTRVQDLCCRMAGDEFIIILPDQNTEACNLLVSRLQDRLAHSCAFSFPVSLSIGQSTYGKHGDTIEALFEHADIDMYKDKRRTKRKQEKALLQQNLELIRPIPTKQKFQPAKDPAA
jgi:diguanylate cyclase (GGDEF)-like protein